MAVKSVAQSMFPQGSEHVPRLRACFGVRASSPGTCSDPGFCSKMDKKSELITILRCKALFKIQHFLKCGCIKINTVKRLSRCNINELMIKKFLSY